MVRATDRPRRPLHVPRRLAIAFNNAWGPLLGFLGRAVSGQEDTNCIRESLNRGYAVMWAAALCRFTAIRCNLVPDGRFAFDVQTQSLPRLGEQQRAALAPR